MALRRDSGLYLKFRNSEFYFRFPAWHLSSHKMVILSYGTIRDFASEHPDAADALNNWYRITEEADWANFNELRITFGAADAVGNGLYVFNIKGNHYRLIARIIFRVRTVYIRFIGTHAGYDKVNLSNL